MEKETQRLFWVNIHYATFGILNEGNRVIDAPPIARWMIGKTLKQIKPWLLKKKAKAIEIK